MSEYSVKNINDKLEQIQCTLSMLTERLSGYDELRKCVGEHERKIGLAEQRCAAIQAGKTKIPWGTVIASIISGVSVGVIISIINYVK